ncbi:MAG: hypothetical protein HQK59_16300 [Deltaproteobacteria bacterium]|nr:hypothetical protein [Deltaproteobacteria bacterium]
MNRLLALVIILLVFLVPAGWAEEFLQAPVIPGGKVINKTDDRLEVHYNLSHKEVLEFYREALKDTKDIKFRERKDETYIEDDGRLPWHSITFPKNCPDGIIVTIVKDNWTWIIGTLILRFIGVFVVLLILYLAMVTSGAITTMVLGRPVKKPPPIGRW